MSDRKLGAVVGTAAVVMMLSACAVTEDSLRASSETLHNTSEASSDFTSSTSHDDDRDDRRTRVRDFTARNLDRLRQDIALGNGVHVHSLAELLAVPHEERGHFVEQAKRHFTVLFADADADVDTVLAQVNRYLLGHLTPGVAAESAAPQ